MRLIVSEFSDPRCNMACDDYVLNHLAGEFLMFYINSPSIIVGRHQNTLKEIDFPRVEEKNVRVVRRISGGGAVYHDSGNLNFSFFKDGADEFSNFAGFVRPVVEFLNEKGLDAELSGRNDIMAGGKKISGNAQVASSHRVLHHGTLLYDTDLTVLGGLLKVNPLKFSDKAVNSVKARVGNLKEMLREIDPAFQSVNTEAFRAMIIERLAEKGIITGQYAFSHRDLAEIDQLKKNKYASWEWNFGRSPAYNFSRTVKTGAGIVELCLKVNRGMIDDVAFFGDFFSVSGTGALERELQGIPHKSAAVSAVLARFRLQDIFGPVTESDIKDLFF